MMRNWSVMVLLVAMLGLIPLAEAADERRAPYTLRVESKARGEVELRGWFSVNGKRVDLTGRRTPFEFRCEAGETIAGLLRTADPARRLRVKVIDESYSHRKAAAWATGTTIDFAWAQPGVGPRTVTVAMDRESPATKH